MFPVFSRMLEEDWRGLSVLYLTPLRALLNNLHPRLSGYADLLGRRTGLWHGDVSESRRKGIRSDPPDVLLTTPESVEAMLISSKTDHRWLFKNLQVVIVDEIHAFAGDDRGWHLLSVTQRVQELAGRELQRVGLSATVGDPDALLTWLTAGTVGRATLLAPDVASLPADRTQAAAEAPDVTLDHVGSIANAAEVISRLHRGEKRLVFVDSRSRAEELTRELRLRGSTTWISHGSLGRQERADTEEAFATSPTGVIVATSTMELGIDVGDLDRVIQIDAPWSVAGFLQRLGRTGRRAGTVSNALFLTTSTQALRDALGLLTAWSEGWIEPVSPPPFPIHVAAQQVLALLRQEGRLGTRTWSRWLGNPVVLGTDVEARLGRLVDHLVQTDVLSMDGELLQIGPEAERLYGGRNYLELTAVFADPPTLAVVHGRTTVGSVHVRSVLSQLQVHDDGVLLLAGRDWGIRDVDWKRRVVTVEPVRHGAGRATWIGAGPEVAFATAQAVRRAMTASTAPEGVRLGKRAVTARQGLLEEFRWLDEDAAGTDVVTGPSGESWWWTFAGTVANRELTERLASVTTTASHSGLAIRLGNAVDATVVRDALAATSSGDWFASIPDEFVDAWKFADVLPDDLVAALFAARDRDPDAVEQTADGAIRGHSLATPPVRP